MSTVPPTVVKHEHESLYQVHYFAIGPITFTLSGAFYGYEVLKLYSVLTFSYRELFSVVAMLRN